MAIESDDVTLGLEEAAALLRLGLESMKRLVDDGAVPAVRLNQKHTVLLRSELIAFVREEGRKQAEARRVAAMPVQPRQRPSGRRRRQLPDLSRYDGLA